MSSDDVASPSQHKSASTSFADVFKTLASTRPRSHSPVPYGQNINRPESLQMEGRRGSRVTFGFEALHRPSLTTSASDPAVPPDYDSVVQALSQAQPLPAATEEAEKISRRLHCFTGEQAVFIWETASYLIDEPGSPEARKAGSRLLEAVAKRQDLSSSSRHIVYQSISQPSAPEVIPGRVNSLIALADHGRKLDFTDEPILPVATLWILPLYDLTAVARSKLKKSKNPRPDTADVEEAALADLFQFIIDLFTLQRHPPSEQDVDLLLQQVIAVCKKTNVAGDIKNSLGVFDAVISTSVIPEASFDPLVEVLCNIHASVKALAGPTSRVVRNLAKSQKQSELIDCLHSFLSEQVDREERNLNVVRGAVNVLSDLVRAYGQDGMPTIAFDPLISSLEASSKKNDGRIDTEILEVCLSVLQGDFVNVALENPWDGFIQVILTSSQRVTDTYVEATATAPITAPPPTAKPSAIDDVRSHISANISRICSAVEAIWPRLDKEQKMQGLRLFTAVHRHLSAGQSKLALDLCKEEQLCYPSHPDWVSRSWGLLKNFILDRNKLPETRNLALATFADAYFHSGSPELFNTERFISSLLADFVQERSHFFFESLVAFLAEVATKCDDDSFTLIIDALSSTMVHDLETDETTPPKVISQSQSSVTSPISSAGVVVSSLCNISSTALVRIFQKLLCTSPTKLSLVYERLIDVAMASERPTDSRLTALRLLFQIRCDTSGSIYVLETVPNEYLVSVLSRNIERSRAGSSDENAVERSPTSSDTVGSGRSSLKDPLSGPLYSTSNQRQKWNTPSWCSDSQKGLSDISSPASKYVVAFRNESSSEDDDKIVLKINLWLEIVIAILQREKNWEVYTYALAFLAAQLTNKDLFRNAMPQIQLLRSVLCEQIKNESFHEPMGWTGVKKGDIAICILESLTMLIGFHQVFAKSEQDDIVRAFTLGIGSWEGTGKGCIHALSVCCHEIPLSVTKCLNAILDKMSKVITRSQIAVHILEFLALLARLPAVYVNLRDEEIRTVFGICLRFIQTSREKRQRSVEQTPSATSRSNSIPSRLSANLKDNPPPPADAHPVPKEVDDMARYVYYLTYHVMVFWFLSLKLQDRAKHVSWITKRLIFTDEHGKDVIEEQSQVFVDFMQRVAYSDLGDTIPYETFPPSESDGPVSKKSWIVGMSIVTIETAGVSGLSQITKRQASGTTYSVYQQRTAPVLPHQIPANPDGRSLSDGPYSRSLISPSHVLLQLTTTAFPIPTSMQPLALPDDDFTRRAISTFDRNDIVDGHKIGIIYIGEDQTDEVSILANTSGSQDYEYFLSSLGTKVSLKDAKFNTQGLHHSTDGEYTYAWRDRVTEIIYHITTMMPTNLEADPQCIYKKQHVGNDFVNIIFNHSNIPFTFDTIKSQFNYVNIVITPTSRILTGESDSEPDMDLDQFNRTLYSVEVLSKPGFPPLSASAVPKVISGRNLAAFVRLMAVNASVFSLVSSRGEDYVSSWQNRLREIRRLRDRAFAASARGTDAGAAIAYPATRRNTKPDEPALAAGVRSSLSGEKGSEVETNVFQNLDFSRWS